MQKQYFGLLMGLLFFGLLSAQTNVTTAIKEATVYLQSAQITRTGKTTIPKGRGNVVLTGLSPQLDHNSVRLGATGDFTILTVTPQNNFLEAATNSPEFTRLTDERRELADALAREKIKMDILTEEEKVIMANKSIKGNSTGVNVDELQKMATYLRTRLGEIRNERLDISEAMRTDQEKLTQLDQQLNEMRQGQRQSVTEVVVQYQAERATEAEFQLTYLVNGASWSPTYDLRVSDLQEDVDLSYGALVNQQTGEDWTNIILTLLTRITGRQRK
ncbi:MAG: mucoidy inhibitor MuiA family protein, partial [Bacteroidota bacterium]